MAVQADGRIVIAGRIERDGGDTDMGVARLDPGGALDTSFAGDPGKAVISFNLGPVTATAVAVQADGRIVVAGTVDRGGGDLDFIVARLNTDGTPDTSFSGDGLATVAFDLGGANADTAGGMAMQPDGRIVVVGTVERGGGNFDFAVARLNANGSTDTSFDGDGRQTVAFDLGGANVDAARGVALQPDGRIVVAGTVSRAGLDQDFGVARLNTDGALDTSFSGDGRRTVAFDLGGANVDRARAVALQPDGRIVVAGAAEIGGGNFDFAVARLDTDGTLDTSFSSDGRATVAFNVGDTNADLANGVAIQPDGKIVVAGDVARIATAGGNAMGVARLHTDSTPPMILDVVDVVPDPRSIPVSSVDVVFSEPIDLSTFDTSDMTLTRDGAPVMLGPAVTVALVSGATYRISGLAGFTQGAGDYVLTVNGSGIRDAAGNAGTGSASDMFHVNTIAADYDGDGQTDLALYHYDAAAGDAVFEIRLSNNGTPMAVTRTITGVGPHVVPVAGDFDGDGSADVAVVDPLANLSGGTAPDATVWIILLSGSGDMRREVPFGGPGVLDRPAPADYDGDGTTDIATFRANSDLVPGAAQWFILPSGPNPGGFPTRDGAFAVVFGAAGGTDLPAPADYDGDGRADIATFRPVSDVHPGAADWFILPSAPNVPNYATTTGGMNVTFGAAGNADQPAVADYNGDGRDDITAFRSESDLAPGSAQWFVLPSAGAWPGVGGGFPVTFGAAGAIAAVGDYNRDGRPDLALFDATAGTWALRDGTGGAALPPVSFGPTGPGVVPVLAPLFFRLQATGNLPGADAAAMAAAPKPGRVRPRRPGRATAEAGPP